MTESKKSIQNIYECKKLDRLLSGEIIQNDPRNRSKISTLHDKWTFHGTEWLLQPHILDLPIFKKIRG